MEDGEDVEEIATPTRRFSLIEITSGLPDDSREADDGEEARLLGDLRGRGKRARAIVASSLGLMETLASYWQKATRFYAKLGVTEVTFRNGVPEGDVTGEALMDASCHSIDALADGGEHIRKILLLAG